MRQHTITGEQILRAVPELEPVAPIVRWAHERYDGAGYPDGLSGDDIPLSSRVILCADAFSRHPVGPSLPPGPTGRGGRPRAAAAHAGTQFDPLIAATLIDVVREASDDSGDGGLRAAFGRSPKLMALLCTLALGGTAMAAEPSLRHIVRDLAPGGRADVRVTPRPLARRSAARS